MTKALAAESEKARKADARAAELMAKLEAAEKPVAGTSIPGRSPAKGEKGSRTKLSANLEGAMEHAAALVEEAQTAAKAAKLKQDSHAILNTIGEIETDLQDRLLHRPLPAGWKEVHHPRVILLPS